MSAELKITTANFDSGTKDGVTLVDFWAPWCAPCLMQGPIIEEVAEKLMARQRGRTLCLTPNRILPDGKGKRSPHQVIARQ